jgi:hypothetical protein
MSTERSFMYSWTQPCCAFCWDKLNPGKSPVTLRNPVTERCVHCGEDTVSGIYIRIDPAVANFPSHVKESS